MAKGMLSFLYSMLSNLPEMAITINLLCQYAVKIVDAFMYAMKCKQLAL